MSVAAPAAASIVVLTELLSESQVSSVGVTEAQVRCEATSSR